MFGEEREYLTIKILHNDMTVMVPCENAGVAGLRRVIDEETVEKVLAVLRDDVSEMPKNWNRRFKHNRDKIKTGDIYELAEVVRNLAIREHEKGLSTGEKQMFTRAKKILASELMYALDKDEDEAEQHLDDLLPTPPRRAPPRPDAPSSSRWRSRSSWPPAWRTPWVPRAQGVRRVGGAARCSSGRSTRCARRAVGRARRRRAPAGRRGYPGVGVRGRRAALAVGAQRAGGRRRRRRRARPRRGAPAGDADLVERALAALDGDVDAVIAAAPVTDTVKEARTAPWSARSTARGCGRSRRRRSSAARRSRRARPARGGPRGGHRRRRPRRGPGRRRARRRLDAPQPQGDDADGPQAG